MPLSVQLAVAADIGHYTYKLAQDFCLRAHYPSFRINALHHIVSITTLSVFLALEQNGLNCLVGLLFEGNLVFFGVSDLLKALRVESHNPAYGMNKYAGFASTVLFRGLLPVAFLAVSLVFGNPFTMDYISIAFYFLSDIFFLILNLWLIKISFDSVRKFRKERKKRAFISDLRDNESQAESVDGAAAADKSRMFSPGNMKYLTPVANANLNTDIAETRVSNIHRSSKAVTNIREVLFPVLPNNERRAAAQNPSICSSHSSDSKCSSTANGTNLTTQIPRQFYLSRCGSSYPDSISLDSVRAPPDGEDSSVEKMPAPPLTSIKRAPRTFAPPSNLCPPNGLPTDSTRLVRHNKSDDSLFDKASQQSVASSSKSSGGKFPIGLFPTRHHSPSPPPYVAQWNNISHSNSGDSRSRTDSRTSSASAPSLAPSRTSDKSGDTSKSTTSHKDTNSSS
ncbi:uncharacterized protein [Ptychodera flava]